MEPGATDTDMLTGFFPSLGHVLDRASIAVEDVRDDSPRLPFQLAGTSALLLERVLKLGQGTERELASFKILRGAGLGSDGPLAEVHL